MTTATKKRKNKTNIIGLKEFRENADAYIKRIDKGESFTVLKRSHPVFKLIPVDEDDDGNWETIADFTTINKNGVPIKDVISALKKMHG